MFAPKLVSQLAQILHPTSDAALTRTLHTRNGPHAAWRLREREVRQTLRCASAKPAIAPLRAASHTSTPRAASTSGLPTTRASRPNRSP